MLTVGWKGASYNGNGDGILNKVGLFSRSTSLGDQFARIPTATSKFYLFSSPKKVSESSTQL